MNRQSSRRSFFKQTVFASEPQSARAPKQQTLVCVFLRGAADTLNLIVPYADDEYYRLRPSIAIAPPSLKNEDAPNAGVKINDFYAFHPLLRLLAPIFQDGRLGIVQAVGSDNPTGSHFEAQDQMEHGEAYGQEIGGGWLGRYLQAKAEDGNLTALSAVAIGQTVPESLRNAPVVSAVNSIDEVQLTTPTGNAARVAAALTELYGAKDVGFLGDPGSETLGLLKRVENLRGKSYHTENNAVYADDSFSRGLREIARLVKAEVGLEIACVDLDGWDTHFFQGTTAGAQAPPINALANGLAAFDRDLIRYRDCVTTIVLTEFGRRSYENSSLGTDHGRGFAALAMGARINGGKIHGDYPGLSGESLIGPGGIKVLIDYRSVLVELLANLMGNRKTNRIFPDFEPQPLGLVN